MTSSLHQYLKMSRIDITIDILYTHTRECTHTRVCIMDSRIVVQ